jgi:integrase
LFLSESRRNPAQPLDVGMWNKVVQRVAGRADVPRFTTHTFRHLRLTDLARCRLDLHEIATYAGHRHLRTTHQYIQLSGTELAARVRHATQHLEQRLEARAHGALEGVRQATPLGEATRAG